ncbi:hypothetical protein MC885_014375 [Smutsia gigantea]|nr:hypothetical protein MC885_014375 [Smutsia gigantea]
MYSPGSSADLGHWVFTFGSSSGSSPGTRRWGRAPGHQGIGQGVGSRRPWRRGCGRAGPCLAGAAAARLGKATGPAGSAATLLSPAAEHAAGELAGVVVVDEQDLGKAEGQGGRGQQPRGLRGLGRQAQLHEVLVEVQEGERARATAQFQPCCLLLLWPPPLCLCLDHSLLRARPQARKVDQVVVQGQ